MIRGLRERRLIARLVREHFADADAHVFPARGHTIGVLRIWNIKALRRCSLMGQNGYAYGWTNEFNVGQRVDGPVLRTNGVLERRWVPRDRTVLVIYNHDGWQFFTRKAPPDNLPYWDADEATIVARHAGQTDVIPAD